MLIPHYEQYVARRHIPARYRATRDTQAGDVMRRLSTAHALLSHAAQFARTRLLRLITPQVSDIFCYLSIMMPMPFTLPR